jgi:4-amino-4-deoxy-L-arabinose transferase-like glycosyltransferase
VPDVRRGGIWRADEGPVAVFLPAVAFFIYLASQKRLGDLRHMLLPTGAVISLAIVVPWYYLLYREHGWEYIGSFIFGENLGRYAKRWASNRAACCFTSR